MQASEPQPKVAYIGNYWEMIIRKQFPHLLRQIIAKIFINLSVILHNSAIAGNQSHRGNELLVIRLCLGEARFPPPQILYEYLYPIILNNL